MSFQLSSSSPITNLSSKSPLPAPTTMRSTIPIPLLLTYLSVASAQGCPDGGTACGYAAQLCCTGDEICMTDENNQALCSVAYAINSTLTLVVSTGFATTTSTSTQVTVSETQIGAASGATTPTSTLFESAAQSAGSSAESSGVELTTSTTSAELTASTDASEATDATEAPASTTTGAGARVSKGWYGVVGVGFGMVTVLGW